MWMQAASTSSPTLRRGARVELFNADNAAYLNALERTMGGLEAKRFVPDLAAGDALIWHGDVIHGALPNVDRAARGNP